MHAPAPAFLQFFWGVGRRCTIYMYKLTSMNFWTFLFSKHFSNIYISLKLRHISQISSPFLSVKGVLFQLCHKSQVPNCCDGEMFLHTSQKKQRHTKLQVKQWLDPWYPLAAWRLQVGFLILCAKKRKTKGFGFLFKKQLTTRQALSNWPWQILAALGY